jgi:hypothetical protein
VVILLPAQEHPETDRSDQMPKLRIGRPQGNRLLGALEPSSRKRIDPHLEPVTLKLGAMVCDAGGLLKHAYFPEGSVSVVADGAGERLGHRDREHRA